MPPLPNVPNVLRVDLIYSIGEDSDITTRLHFRYTGGAPSAADCIALAGDIATEWNTALKPLLLSGGVLETVRVTDLTTPSSGDGETNPASSGSRSGQFLPTGACLLSNYQISRRYRGGKPRSYHPFGVAGDMVDGQKWTASFISASSSGVLAFLAVVGALTQGSTSLNGPCSVSYYDGFTVVTSPTTGRARNVPKLRTTPVVDTINSATSAAKIAYQRRRSVR